MWQIATMLVVGAIQGTMEGDSIMDEAEGSAEELELEGARIRRNAYKESRDVFVAEELASGTDQALETASNISSGMNESSASNQMLAANRQAAMRESQDIIDEGDRMNRLYRERASTTLDVGKKRAKKAVVTGIVGGAVAGYGMGKK